ncbi:tRNA (5-methylaminomethyl-2-thiouridine)(34)-methyltransferase MnmD [Nanoarchaeota archaeon]
MKTVQTRDKSITFFNERFQESYHSTTIGAIEEAEKKYVEPAHLKDGVFILDFCFGLGYNSLAALMKLDQVTIITLENDQEILKQIETLEVPEPYQEKYEVIQKVAKNKEFDNGQIKIKLILGNAQETIKILTQKFDAVFFDPFSPKKCPELWTLEVFQDVFKLMKPGAILTTYSCATKVRENMKAAGFQIKDSEPVGRKSPGTIGIK